MGTENIEALKAALAKANVELEAATRALAPKHVGGEIEAYEAALLATLKAERKLAAAEGRAYAVLEACPLSWDVGAPLPTLVQSDYRAVLFFLLADDDDAVGLVEFEGCLATSFGSPSDETFSGHPLYGSGFEPYRLMSVINSPWIAQLRRIDSVHSSHDPKSYERYRHLIFPFHDSTFECVARSFTASRLPGPLSDAVRDALGRML